MEPVDWLVAALVCFWAFLGLGSVWVHLIWKMTMHRIPDNPDAEQDEMPVR